MHSLFMSLKRQKHPLSLKWWCAIESERRHVKETIKPLEVKWKRESGLYNDVYVYMYRCQSVATMEVA